MSERRALRILISAGPTREPIDPVRFISNYSTGYMGARLAAAALARGHRVTVVSGPIIERLPAQARVIRVERAREMERALRREGKPVEIIIMAAAVADFRPIRQASAKLPRGGRMRLALEATPDIVARLPRRRRQLIVGFALETGRVVPRAIKKLREKRLDLLLAQQADDQGSPFGRQKVLAWLVARGSVPQATVTALGRVSKSEVARALLDKIEALWYGQRDKNIEGLKGFKKAQRA